MTKSGGSIHAQRSRSTMTLCGRRIVGMNPRHQEVRRSLVTADPTRVTCKSCRANLGLEAPIHVKGSLRS